MTIDDETRDLAKSGPGSDAFKAAVRIAEAAWDRVQALGDPDMKDSLVSVGEQLSEIVATTTRVVPDRRIIDKVSDEGMRADFITLFGTAFTGAHNSGNQANVDYLYAIIDSLCDIANAPGDVEYPGIPRSERPPGRVPAL